MNCKRCDKFFYPKTHNAKFCSKNCSTNFFRDIKGLTSKGRYSFAKKEKSAKKHGFELTLEEYTEIMKLGHCTYCTGPLPKSGTGLDRLDSNKPYTKDNVVPCCRYCNQLKNNTLTFEETHAMVNLLRELRKKDCPWL